MFVYVPYAYVSDGRGGLKRLLDPLEVKLQILLSQHVADSTL